MAAAVAAGQVLYSKAAEGKSLAETWQILVSAFSSVLFWVVWPGAVYLVVLAWLLSIFVPKFRSRTWVRAYKWVRRVHVLSGDQYDSVTQASYDEGYAERTREVEVERARALSPDWRIFPKERADEYCLYNWGYAVGNVRLSAPEELFVFTDMAPWWKGGPFGNNSSGGSDGRLFYGRPTPKGRVNGVTFTVSWTDELGNPAKNVVSLRSDQLNPTETAEEAFARGYAAGTDEAREQLSSEPLDRG